jgi:pimeloyl-ACP methyl ester carboxylesterase
MRKPEELADADSLFLKCCGVTAHYKCVGPEFHEPTACAIACYHGFGANLWSWELVQRRLAESIGGLVSAHDMPGFGLTERSEDQKVFSLMTNGNIGRQILSHELANLGAYCMS